MSIFLKFKPFEAPHVYLFKDPDTGYNYQADTLKELYSLIIGYRSQNELKPIEELPLVVENYLCKLPCHGGKCTDRTLERSVYSYLKGGVALLTNLLYSSMVSDAEADRRGEICNTCPLNVFPDKKAFLKWSDRIAEASTKGRRSSFHNRLGNCEACTCVLKAKVFLKGPITLSEDERTQITEANPLCWQLNG